MGAKTKRSKPQPGLVGKVMARLKGKTEKGPQTLYLSKVNYDRLKEFCDKEDTSPSQLIDELIAVFLEDQAI